MTINTNDNEDKLFHYDLDCGHFVLSTTVLRLQYPSDTHLILCPECERLKRDVYLKPLARIPTAWRNVTGSKEVDPLHNVLSRDAYVLPDRILRLQPAVPSHRARPFPYVKRVRK